MTDESHPKAERAFVDPLPSCSQGLGLAVAHYEAHRNPSIPHLRYLSKVEGTQPETHPAPEPKPAPKARSKWIPLVLIVAVVVVVAALSFYFLKQPPPIHLTVTDGSTSHVVEATFADFGSLCPTYRAYSATTSANESGGATSALNLRLYLGAYMDGDLVRLDLFPVVSGSFAPDLHPDRLTLGFNETGARYTDAFGWPYTSAFNNSFPAAPVAFPGPTNVSINPQDSLPEVVGNGSTSLDTSLVNTSTSMARYKFLYAMLINIQDPLGDNAFFAVRATVTGPFAPAPSVGILVHLVDVPTPPSTFEVSLNRPGDASRWILTVVDPGGTYANGSVDVRVVTLDGATVVPATPLGDLYRSPYNTSLAYLPSGTSGLLSGQDVITVSAAAYGLGDLLQAFLPKTSGDVLLYALTLG